MVHSTHTQSSPGSSWSRSKIVLIAFEFAEHVLDPVALAVENAVMGYRDFPVRI